MEHAAAPQKRTRPRDGKTALFKRLERFCGGYVVTRLVRLTGGSGLIGTGLGHNDFCEVEAQRLLRLTLAARAEVVARDHDVIQLDRQKHREFVLIGPD